MKRVPGIVGLISITVLAGCDSGTNITDAVLSEGKPATIGADQTIESEQPDQLGEVSTSSGTIGMSIPITLMDQFSGGTFVSAEPVGPADIGQRPSHSLVSFSADTVTWEQRDVISIGSYGSDENSNRVADFSGNEINFDGDGNDLTWDSQSYYRTTSALFDSQETLKTQFDGTEYISVEDFSIGETVSGDMVMGKWSVRFEGDQLHLATQDTIAVGTYTYSSNRSFNVAFGSNVITGYALSNDRLLVDSVVYKKDFSNLFDSQESLVEFLNGTSYKSSGLQTVGPVVDGGVSIGYWFIDFTDNTFVWSSQDGDEAGVVEYLVDNTFKAIFADREYIIEMQSDDILWDGVRYIKE